VIYAGATARRLALVRIAVFAIWLVDLASAPIDGLAALPPSWFAPHGPWLLVPDGMLRAIWNDDALLGLQLTTLLTVGLALIGAPGRRAWGALACVLLTIVSGFVRGFGHADHAQLQLLFVTFALVFLPAWDTLCLGGASRAQRGDEAVYCASCVALALVFSFPYLLTAAYRLTHEGAAIFLGGSMRHFIARDTLSLDHLDFRLGLVLLQYPTLTPMVNAGFAVVTAAELLAPWAFLRRSWAVAWLATIGPFHVLAPLIMHVLFPHNVALLLVLYLWPLFWVPRSALHEPAHDRGQLRRSGHSSERSQPGNVLPRRRSRS
jgi:hypothetical protein